MSASDAAPGPAAPRPADHARAGAVGVVWALLLLLGAPGLDQIAPDALGTAEERTAYTRRMPAWTLPVADGVVTVNREVRRPLARAFDAVQRPFRIKQAWGLYSDGEHRCKRLEILVDGALVHRTKDPTHAWLADTLSAPPIRPIVDGTAGKSDGGANWRGLMRLVGRAAERDFPGAREVTLRAMWGPYPTCVTTEHHTFTATAPFWGEP